MDEYIDTSDDAVREAAEKILFEFAAQSDSVNLLGFDLDNPTNVFCIITAKALTEGKNVQIGVPVDGTIVELESSRRPDEYGDFAYIAKADTDDGSMPDVCAGIAAAVIKFSDSLTA